MLLLAGNRLVSFIKRANTLEPLFPPQHPSPDYARLIFAWLVFAPSLLSESLAQARTKVVLVPLSS